MHLKVQYSASQTGTPDIDSYTGAKMNSSHIGLNTNFCNTESVWGLKFPSNLFPKFLSGTSLS